MFSSIVEKLKGLFSGLVKYLPIIAAYFAGKASAKTEVTQENFEAKVEQEEAGQKVRDELRDKPTGDYIRENRI